MNNLKEFLQSKLRDSDVEMLKTMEDGQESGDFVPSDYFGHADDCFDSGFNLGYTDAIMEVINFLGNMEIVATSIIFRSESSDRYLFLDADSHTSEDLITNLKKEWYVKNETLYIEDVESTIFDTKELEKLVQDLLDSYEE